MLSRGISCILLLIHIIGIVNGDITRAIEGKSITLSCGVTRSNIADIANITALWKKETGQKVIWKYLGEKKKDATFLNREIDISDSLSLTIDKCNQTDQGVYILCINGKPSCTVRLLVTGNKRCQRSTDELCSYGKSSSDTTQDADENNPNENPTNPRSSYLTIAGLLLFLSIIFCLVVLHITRKDTTKNDKSEHKVLNPPCTVIQIS